MPSTASIGPLTGVWDRWKNRETGELLTSCAMIITEPNDFVAEIHDRMPVLLAERDFESWLRGEAGVELLKQRRTISYRNGPYRSASAARRLTRRMPR